MIIEVTEYIKTAGFDFIIIEISWGGAK